MFKKWLPLIGQLTFGWDTIIGLGIFTLMTTLFSQQVSIIALLVAGFCAYAPDADFVLFLAFRKKYKVTVGHWVFGHYPILVLPLIACGVWLFSRYVKPGSESYFVTMCVVCTTCHFIHDSISEYGGFHFFAPFRRDGSIQFTLSEPWMWTHYKIGRFGLRKATTDEVADLYTRTYKMSLEEGGDEVTGRVEHVTNNQLVAFGFCMCALCLLAIARGICIL